MAAQAMEHELYDAATTFFELLERQIRKEQTQNNIIKRGLLEKIIGGIGPNQIPNSP